VAAQHINADLVIHFGHACMTPTSRLPVYYHFHQLPLDIDQCVQSFRHRVEANNSPLLLISDQEYNYCLGKYI
jgi:diphthamide biosynthesis protein 2